MNICSKNALQRTTVSNSFHKNEKIKHLKQQTLFELRNKKGVSPLFIQFSEVEFPKTVL